ncbi:MAG TPA: STAS domain-containing protein [Roseiflexaceae bacterium]|nr:STAS domain-containing protein [Roseiflexaceae bacterium]
MAEVMGTTHRSYGQQQQTLFEQILNAVRMAAVLVLLLSLGASLFLETPGSSTLLLAALVAIELGVTETSRWLIRHGRSYEGGVAFVALTLIVASSVAVVLNSLAFSAMTIGVLIAISALLIGPRATLLPGILGGLLFVAFSIAERQNWFAPLALSESNWAAVLLQIVFVLAATAVLLVVCVLASSGLQRNAREAQERADEAERARVAQAQLNERLEQEVNEQRRLLEVIKDLETPIIPLRAGVLVLPLVGHLETRRWQQIEQRLLERVAADRVDLVLLDITGVPQVDSAMAADLLRIAQAIRLLGARITLTGIQPDTAHALARLELDLSVMKTHATIQDALAHLPA